MPKLCSYRPVLLESQVNFYQLRAELAVMLILQQSKATVSEPIELHRIWNMWPQYELRGRDMPIALDRLELLGLIQFDNVMGQRTVALTKPGETWLRSIESRAARPVLIPRYVRSWIGRLWPRASASNHPHRRLDDRFVEE
ncbi:MAG: hypothetical protein ACT4PZ_19105 [Panacagrimonas sp.]